MRTRAQVFPLEVGDNVVTAVPEAVLSLFIDPIPCGVFRGLPRVAVLESDAGKAAVRRRLVMAPVGQSLEVPDGNRAVLLGVLALAPNQIHSVVELVKVPKAAPAEKPPKKKG